MPPDSPYPAHQASLRQQIPLIQQNPSPFISWLLPPGQVLCLSLDKSNSFPRYRPRPGLLGAGAQPPSFLACTFIEPRQKPGPKYIEQRKPFSAIINEMTFTGRKKKKVSNARRAHFQGITGPVCGGGGREPSLNPTSPSEVSCSLQGRDTKSKEGTQKARFKPLLPAQTKQTKPPHTKVAHLEKFQTIAI